MKHLVEEIMCPTCGHTNLRGTLEISGGWLACTQCRFCVSDKPSIRLWLSKVKPGST